MTKLYPKGTIRRVVKAHEPQHKLLKSADVLVYLDYVLFIKELMKEADIGARETGDTKIRGIHVNRSINKTLRKFRG